MLALCLALALLATDGDGLRFEGSVAAGGGYDTNLLIAPGSDAAGSAVASVSASGGAAIDLSDSAFLYVGRRPRRGEVPHAPGARPDVRGRLREPARRPRRPPGARPRNVRRLRVVRGPGAQRCILTARATLRYRPVNWLTTRLGYSHTLRTASDSVYGSNIDRVFAEVEFRAARSTWFSVAAFGERGDPPSTRRLFQGRRSATAATVTTFEPYRAPATTLGVGSGSSRASEAGSPSTWCYMATNGHSRRHVLRPLRLCERVWRWE